MNTTSLPSWLYDPLSLDERQTPSRKSESWNDESWRNIWLAGFTDKELEAMTPRHKGAVLRAYYYDSGYEHFGLSAYWILIGYSILQRAGISHDKLSLSEVKSIGYITTEGPTA